MYLQHLSTGKLSQVWAGKKKDKTVYRKVKVGNEQEMEQSERNSHSKNQVGGGGGNKK